MKQKNPRKMEIVSFVPALYMLNTDVPFKNIY